MNDNNYGNKVGMFCGISSISNSYINATALSIGHSFLYYSLLTLGSTPVGLWPQAWNNKIEWAGIV